MKFVVYSKDNCPYCSKVIKLLEFANLQYEVKKLDVDFNRDDFYVRFGRRSTFPRVLLDEKLIGGCTETLQYLSENKII
jgi:glutaredoxin